MFLARSHQRIGLIAISLLALIPLHGCDSTARPTTVPGDASTMPVGAGASGDVNRNEHVAGEAKVVPVWPFWPVGMRLHPLTRLAIDPVSGEQVIECRVEFQDIDGLTSKAVGQLTLQVYPDGVTATGTGALETWNQDLRDLQLNHRQYDDVTRTYLFRLQTAQPLPIGCELRVFFLSVDGRRMNAEMRLRQ